MPKPELDHRLVRERLESWALTKFAAPCGIERMAWPGGRSDAIGELLWEHLQLHGATTAMSHCKMPCRVAAVAFALWELTGYEQGMKSDEVSRIEALERAATENLMLRKRALELANELRTRLDSWPLAVRRGGTRGQPRKALGDAICMHLRDGGFTAKQIRDLLGLEPTEAARRRVYDRLKNDDHRTVVPFPDHLVQAGQAH